MSKHIVIVEDSVFFREVWSLFNDRSSLTYDCPSAFLKAMTEDPVIVEQAELLVLDNHFDQDGEMSGIELAQAMRQRGFTGKIILATLSDVESSEFIDGIAGKSPDEVWQTYLSL